MDILLIGSGGREHAIAWKLAQSLLLNRLYIAPGNPGTQSLGENILLDINDHDAVVRFCLEKGIDMVVVGPETPLADGLSDSLILAGIRCFGPSKAAAQIEASKVFSKNFMARHGIPTARYAVFNKLADAIAYLPKVNYPIVIKASGLAAGKGVILPDSLEEANSVLESIFVNRLFGQAGEEVVIEERLSGPEISLMAFTDGKTVLPMLPAQDHKRLLDGDRGPNTGGMGAYAPAPILTKELLEEALESVLKLAINGLRIEGTPFVGIIYAGLMLTNSGLRVLEFNCRFGDPETQAVLPLLQTDLLSIMDACVNGNLHEKQIDWKDGASVSVVVASKGYPEKAEVGKIVEVGEMPADTVCFHAGTMINADGQLVTSGGRVLAITSWAASMPAAIQAVYTAVRQIHIIGMQYRQDIAAQVAALQESLQAVPAKTTRDASSSMPKAAYEDSGVSIDAGNKAVELMKEAVKATYTPAVLAGIGSFGGLFDAAVLKGMKNPVLVASTDGVGTKVKLAAQVGRYRSIGHDIVNHCINDILVQGARPLFFMDYFATSRLNPEQAAEVVTGIAEACREAEMALLGGETAEMPGVYTPGEFDVAGTIVGVLERDNILPRTKELKPGDVLIGLASSGPHTNGYSLIRKIFIDTSLDTIYPEIGISLADALLAPHRSYLKLLGPALQGCSIKALAHLTGGGFIENIPRILPGNLTAEISLGAWPASPLWRLIQQKGNIDRYEMYRVFNMGIGMVVIADKGDAVKIRKSIPEETWEIGTLTPGNHQVTLI